MTNPPLIHFYDLPPNVSAAILATHPVRVDVSYDLTPWQEVDVHYTPAVKEVPVKPKRKRGRPRKTDRGIAGEE